MMEIVAFLAIMIIVVLLAMYGAWRFFLSGDMRTALTQILNIISGRDLEVDPEKPLPPSNRHKISESIEAHGEQAKQRMSIQRGSAMATPDNRPATATPQPPQSVQTSNPATPTANPKPHNPAVKDVVDNRTSPTQPARNPVRTQPPPSSSPPVAPPANTGTMNTQAVPPQKVNTQDTNTRPHPGHALPPLVESHSFGVHDPIIDDIYIEEGTPSADTLDAHPPAYDSSRFGVRSSTISPGRRLRDKRYKRNSS